MKDGTPYPFALGPIDNGYKLKIMAQQTAVEWLLNEIADNSKTHNQWKKVIEQAKAMEKEQIIQARYTAPIMPYIEKEDYEKEAEQYYNETYGSQGSNDTTSPNN